MIELEVGNNAFAGASRRRSATPRKMLRPAIRDLAIVLAVSWLARVAFVIVVGDAHSLDVEYWQGVLVAIDEGRNPYETGALNWPPLWLEIIVGVDALAELTHISFWSALRVYLVVVESTVVVALYLTLVGGGAARDVVRRALLVGVALNPVAILLVCQHGNSDVNVGLLVTLAVAALIAHRRSRDVVFWLGGCLLLGLGVLAKTVPLVLAPLLAPGARRASPAGKALGAALLLGPAALGLSVIMSLAPEAVMEHVIRYRSTSGFFGIAGLLELMSSDAPSLHGKVFTVGVIVLVFWLWRRLSREAPLPAETLFLLVAVVFMLVVFFGSGYGPQYVYWFLPALVATYVLLDDGWRRLLGIGYVVAGVTYVIEYAFIPWLGWYAEGRPPRYQDEETPADPDALAASSGWVVDIADYLDVPHRLILFRLPLVIVYLLLISEGIARLVEQGVVARRPQLQTPRGSESL